MAQSQSQYTIEDDEKKPASSQFSIGDDEGAADLSDEEIKKNLPGSTPLLRESVRKGVAPMTKPTQFEEENKHPENYGFTTGNVLKNIYQGAKGLIGGGLEGAYDLALGEGKNEKGEMEHGLGGLVGLNAKGEFDPTARVRGLAEKYITDPAVAEAKKAEEEAKAGNVGPAVGHGVAATLPVIGPWAASLGEQARTGDVGGAAGQALGTVGTGELIPRIPALADKVARGTPLTEAGKLEAAKQQALTVKKPTMTETEYEGRVQAALPELQRIAQENAGQIKTPRQAAAAIGKRIEAMEAPISHHIADLTGPEATVHPGQYVDQVNAAIDQALAKNPGQLTPEEIEKAKGKIDKFVGDQPKTLAEIEGNRKRLNRESDDYFSSRPADKRVMDTSDATAIAQRAAANAIRDILYGDDTNPGLLERAGVTAVDQTGKKVSMRDFRRSVGNLMEIRSHFEDAITRAEATGDWKPFEKVFSGPSLAAGGLGTVAGLVAGGPVGALFGTLAGEGAKAWGDYLRSKNPNLNVQKMFRNLEQTGKPNTVDINTQTPVRPAPAGLLPSPRVEVPYTAEDESGAVRGGRWTTPAGLLKNRVAGLLPGIGELSPRGVELPMPGTAELEHPEMFPKEPISAPAQRQVYRDPDTGRMQRGFTGESTPPVVGQTAEGGPIREPLAPIEASRKVIGAPEAAGGPKRGAEGPEGELGRIGAGRPESAAATTIGGPGREAVLRPLGEVKTTAAADLKVGDTFVDDKGDPRRITEITEDGKIKTADHTLRDYEEGEIEHLGEINSPKARLAQGGMFHPGEKVMPMTPPGAKFSGIYDSDEGPGWKQFFVSNEKGIPVTHMIVSPEGDALAVRLVDTMEESQKQGFGSAAYNRAIQYAKEKGFKRLISDPEGGTKPEAANIWRKLGAEETGTKKDPSFSLDLGKPQTKELAPGQTTYEKYYDKNLDAWSPERQAIHNKVAADAIKGKTFPKDRAPEAIITVGGTAAGKTTLTRAIMGEDPNRVNIDSDANKLHIPEYKDLQKSDPKKAAARVHDESKAISKGVIQAAVKRGLDFVYDTSTGGGGEKLFKRLKDLGYKVRLVYADVPTDEAVERANKRAKESEDPINRGRFVPEAIIRKKHVEAARAFRTFMDSPSVDEIRAFDTTEREPKEFFRRGDGGEKILDQKLLDRVKEKANERIEGQK